MTISRKNILTTFLTSASILTLVASSQVMGTMRTTLKNTNLNNASGFNPNGFVNGDILLFNGNHNVRMTDNNGPFPSLVDFNNTGGDLRFQSGIDVVVNATIRSNGGNDGRVRIEDSGTQVEFTGVFDPMQPIDRVAIDSGATGTFNTNLYVEGPVDLQTGGTIIVNPGFNVTASNIRPDNSNQGTISFFGNSIVDARIGNNNSVGTVNVGGAVDFKENRFFATDINFTTSNSSIKFTGKGNTIEVEGKLVNQNGGNTGKLIVGEDVEYEGDIASSGQRIDSIIFEADKAFTYKGNGSLFSNNFNVFTQNPIAPSPALGTGMGTFNAVHDRLFRNIDVDFGTPDRKLKYVSFSPSKFPITFNILFAGRSIHANELDLYPREHTGVNQFASVFTFSDQTTLNANVTTFPGSNIGELLFQKNSTITGDLGQTGNGNLRLVSFSSTTPTDIITFRGNIFASNIIHNSPILTLPQDSDFNGRYFGTSPNYSLAQSTLRLKGMHNHSISGNSKFEIEATETKAGNLLVDGGTMNMNNLGAITLNLNDRTVTLPFENQGLNGNVFRELQVFGGENGANFTLPDDAKVNFTVVNSTNLFLNNPLVTWTYSQGKIIQNVAPDIGQAIFAQLSQGVTDPTTLANLDAIANAFSEITNDLLLAENVGALQQFLDSLQGDVSLIGDNINATFRQALNESVNGVLERLNQGLRFFVADDDTGFTGVAAGSDTGYKYGAWTSYSFSGAVQRNLEQSPGYRTKSHTVTVGGDMLVGESTTIGIAASFNKGHINHKDQNLGDKSETDSYIGSIYAMQEFTNNWFLQGVGVFGHTDVENSEIRVTGLTREVATAKYDNYSYGAQFIAGHNFQTSGKTIVTPSVGIEYTHITRTKYTETGTTNQNLKVNKSPDDKLEISGGLSVAKKFQYRNYDLTPEAHASIKHDLFNQRTKLLVTLDNISTNLVPRSTELHRTFYNAGGSITTSNNEYDLVLSYDAFLAKRHISQQGTVKVRVNF